MVSRTQDVFVFSWQFHANQKPELAELHSMAVDFPKTGEREHLGKMVNDLVGAIIPKKLRPRRWPEYISS
jgi:hypothetical protein